MFTKFGNVNVHATSVKVIIVYPNSFEGEVSLQNFIDVSTGQTEQFGLFGGEARKPRCKLLGSTTASGNGFSAMALESASRVRM